MSTFDESVHPRQGDGKFAIKAQSEADVDLPAPGFGYPDVEDGFYEPDDLHGAPAAYTYQSEVYTPQGLIETLIRQGQASPAAREMAVEDVLDQVAGANAIDRDDEHTYDSADFPKPVMHDQMVAGGPQDLIGSDGTTRVLYGEPHFGADDLAVGAEQALKTVVWSSTDENGEPFGDVEISDELADRVDDDFKEFVQDNAVPVQRARNAGQSIGQIGHDYVLTRNRHGAGFWDRGLGTLGDDLTTAAHTNGELDVYVGDDGKLHASEF